MLIYSMGVSIDGFITDRMGSFDWGAPSDELFRFHLERVAGLGGHLTGRRLYQAMRVWETDASLRDTPDHRAFADVWAALPKVVFSRSLDRVEGNARLATASPADELAAMRDAAGAATAIDIDIEIEIGGAGLAAQAVELDLVDELRIFRHPVIVGGGVPFLPPLAEPRTFSLVETRPFGGVVYERYCRARRPV